MNKITKLALAALVAAPLSAFAEEAQGPTVSFSGMVDSYYTLNLDQPQSFSSPTGGYTAPTGFNLNFAKITASAESGPGSVRIDLGFAREGSLISSAFGGQSTFVQQAYGSYKLGGITLEAGRFVTPAGFEVFEAKDNWLYSRGLLFNFAVPTAHEGVRVAVPVGETFTVTGYLANGSDLFTNDVGFSQSPYKTGALSLAYSTDATTAYVTGFVSKDPASGEDAYLVDAVITQSVGALSVNVSGDYGKLGDLDAYWGVGGSLKLELGEALRVVGRAEYFTDPDACHTVGTAAEAADALMSFTAGVNYLVGSNAELRAEVRLDRADEKIYGPEADLLAGDGEKQVATFTVGAIAWF